MVDVIVVGAGHNGLVAACYLAAAGRDVLVLEAQARPGGGARTEERIPGYRFDVHSVAHNIINMSAIPEELDLAGAGLHYQEMDPFSVAVRPDGHHVRFFRSVEATAESIAEVDGDEAAAYSAFMELALPIVRLMVPSAAGSSGWGRAIGRAGAAVAVARRGLFDAFRDAMSPYDSLLRRHLASDLTRGPVAAFAAHAGVGPNLPGGSLFAFWQAAYHIFGQWHARGGAGGLTDALVVRLEALGGQLRCSAPVTRLETSAGRIIAVHVGDEERITARAVVTAIDPKVAMFDLLDPPLGGLAGQDLAATRRGNVVQALVHVAIDRLPAYPGARPGDWNGLQSFVDDLEQMTRGWAAADAGLLPDPMPLYAFTTSAIDDSLAPPGHHALYLACPAAPAWAREGWPVLQDRFVEGCLSAVERRAPGFSDSVVGVAPWTPHQMAADEGWVGAHPMHLDIAMDQLGIFRPTRRLGRHRTPVEGLYLSGAGSAPSGGISGMPGKQAARALLKDGAPRSRPATAPALLR